MTEKTSREPDPRRSAWDATYREKNREKRREYDRERQRVMRAKVAAYDQEHAP
jgi:hypothetical protein